MLIFALRPGLGWEGLDLIKATANIIFQNKRESQMHGV